MNQAIIEVLLKQFGINPTELGAMLENAKNIAEQHVASINARLLRIEETQLDLSKLVCDLKNTIDGLHSIVRENNGEIIPAGSTDGE